MIRVLPPIAVAVAIAIVAWLARPHVVHPEPPSPVATPRPLHTPFDPVRSDLLGCFAEWAERGGGDVDMTVRTSADGYIALSGPPPLKICVASTLESHRSPLNYDVQVHWDGELELQLEDRRDLMEPLDAVRPFLASCFSQDTSIRVVFSFGANGSLNSTRIEYGDNDCVEQAFARVVYPSGPRDFLVRATATWQDGKLTLSADRVD